MPHRLVALCRVAVAGFLVLGDGVLASLALAGFPGDMSLVFTFPITLLSAAVVMGPMAGAHR